MLFVACLIAFSAQGQQSPKVPQAVKDTVLKGVTHKLYVGAKGGRYIFVTSKTGTVYKRYFTAKKVN